MLTTSALDDIRTDAADDNASAATRARAPTFNARRGTYCCGRLEYGYEPWHLGPYHPDVYKANKMQLFNETVAGITVAFAQVSESIAFAFIAGVGPLLGLHAGWIIGISLALFGSRPGMISGATGVRAAVLRPYVVQFGIGHLFYIVFVISIFQFAMGTLKLAKFVRLVPRPCMIGFVNGLALILAMGQVPQFNRACSFVQQPDVLLPTPEACGPMVFDNVTNTSSLAPGGPAAVLIEGGEIGLMMIHIVLVFIIVKLAPLVPKYGKYIPASLCGILVSTAVEWAIIRPSGGRTPIIGEVGRVSGGLPIPFFLDPQYEGRLAPFNWETISACIFPAFIAAGAGAVEAVMTMEEVNDRTETENDAPNQQLFALSIGNAVGAIYGTIGGGANIPMSVLNLEAGANGRFRISGVIAGLTVFIFVMVAAPLIAIIPTSSLIGLMVAVILATMDWGSIWLVFLALVPQSCRLHPRWLRLSKTYPSMTSKRKIRRIDALVIVIVWVVTILQDLFVAVAIGIVVTALAFVWEVGERIAVSKKMVNGRKVYTVHGPLFFASTQTFIKLFDFKGDPDVVELHFDRDGSDLKDFSGLHCLNVIADKYKKQDKRLVVKHLPATAIRMIAKADGMLTFEVAEAGTVVVEMAAAGGVALEAETRVQTYMGPGLVQGVNDDGMCVVILDWRLANEARATLYCRANQVTPL